MSDVNELLAKSLSEIKHLKAENRKLEERNREPIAIVGAACRYPGRVGSLDALWRFLHEGGDGVGRMSEERWPMARFYSDDSFEPGTIYSDAMGLIEGIDQFDARLFGLKPEEAKHIDPQHRLLMELTWETIEDAGYAVESLTGSRTGVYVGIMSDDYGQLQGELEDAKFYMGSGIAKSCAAGRIAFTFGLEGPTLALDSACSSSLVAVHLAVQALRRGECEAALAGGVNLILSPQGTVVACRSQMLSKRGHCHVFDERADGYVRAEGCGLVMLKRLSDAQRDGDRIYALIRGSAVNHNGRSQGLTAPSGQAQRRVIAAALEDANVNPEAVSFLECHGTGTALGDPIEVRAIEASYVHPCVARRPLLIGAVKSNLGHMESAAGIGGLHKAIMVVRNREVPRNLHFQSINPHIKVDLGNIRIPTESVKLPAEGPLLAAVSSFGFSGTNAHVIIESYAEAVAPYAHPPTRKLFKLSANSHAALLDYSQKYVEMLADEPPTDIESICRTAAIGRGDGNHRIAFTVDDANDLRACLEEFKDVVGGDQEQPAVVPFPMLWLIDGDKHTDWLAAAMLYRDFSCYRDAIVDAFTHLKPRYPEGLRDFISLLEGDSWNNDVNPLLPHALHRLAQGTLLVHCGLNPSQVCGFGYSELVAATIAGVLSVRELVDILYEEQVPAQFQPKHGRYDFLSTLGEGVFLPTNWDRRVLVESIGESEHRRVLLASFLEQKCVDGRHASIHIGTVPQLHLSDELAPAIFHWVHGMTNRDDDRRIECLLARCYMAGAPVRWSHVYWDSRAPKSRLPGYPFQRERYWTEWGYSFDSSLPSTVGSDAAAVPMPARTPRSERQSEDSRMAVNHRFLKTVSLCPSGARNFCGDLSLAQLPYLSAHRIFNAAVIPASLYVDLIATAGKWLWPRSALLIDDLRLQHKRILGEAAIHFYCHLRPAENVVEIYTREDASQDWQQNVRASLRQIPQLNASHQDISAYKSACPEAVPLTPHYDGLGQSGLNYGPDFRGIFELWRGNDCALAKISLPPTIDQGLDGYFAHPILFDACLQAISAAGSFDGDGKLFVPAAIRGIRCNKPLPEFFWCFVRVSPMDSDSDRNQSQFATSVPYCASMTLLDSQGDVVMTIDRFETMLARDDLAKEEESGNFRDWLYEKRWQANESFNVGYAGLPALSDIEQALYTPATVGIFEENFTTHVAAKTAIDRLASAYILEALEVLGIVRKEPLSVASLASQGVNPQHAQLSKRLLAILSEAGCAIADGDAIFLSEAALTMPPSRVLEGDIRAAFPELVHELDFLVPFGRELAALLTGDKDPLNFMFTDQNEDQTRGVYQNAEGASDLNQLISKIIAHACSAREDGRKVQILEVGAGTGATAAHIMPRLKGMDIEYVFTDISQHFISRAKEKFIEYPFMDFELLDISADPDSQPIAARSFDIIIAVNVIHATADIGKTLENLNRYLRAGGMLVLKELTQPQAWVDMTFGLTQGWWNFTDYTLRQDGPLLDVNQWLEVLDARGFAGVVANAHETDTEALRQIPEAVIFAEKRRSVRSPMHWVLFSDQGKICDDLEFCLRAQGDRVSVLCLDVPVKPGRLRFEPETSASFVELLADLTGRQGPIDGIIYGWSLPVSDPLGDALLPALERNAKFPLHLCQALLRTQWRGIVPTFLTQGAQPVLDRVEQPLSALLWGHVNCFVNENGLYARIIDLEPGDVDVRGTSDRLLRVLEDHAESQFAFRQGRCYSVRLKPTSLEHSNSVDILPDASYLITGGFGALGLQTALELARQGARHIILVGRDVSKGENNPIIERIREMGGKTYHLQADVADSSILHARLFGVLGELPPLRGVVHSVGVLADGVIEQQTWEQYLKVFGPKVLGTLHLYRAVQDYPLDFFILYSSAAAVLGSPGQANHAAANTFLDSFAWYLRTQSRPGLSINWGGWSEIGAAAEYANGQLGRTDSLIGFIPPEQGVEIITRQFATTLQQFAVIPIRTRVPIEAGKMPYLRKLLDDILVPVESSDIAISTYNQSGSDALHRLRRVPSSTRSAAVRKYLSDMVADLLNGRAVTNTQTSLFDMGLDSLLSIDLRLRLEKELECRLPSTLLHDNPSIDSLATFLLEVINRHVPAPPAVESNETSPKVVSATTVPPKSNGAQAIQNSNTTGSPVTGGIAFTTEGRMPKDRGDTVAQDIAIIGISGRFPGASDVDTLWENLAKGHDSITGIPATRWDHDAYFTHEKNVPGKSYCAWGGFLEGVDEFDPLFFNIPPRMAAFIDPKERLFLETTWNLLEEAGYTRDLLQGSYERKVGVFVGAMYQLYSSLAGNVIEDAATALSSYNAIANRVSYFFDLRGPSIAVDTMCSSSLTAIDMACQSLQTGGCRLAIAGGVNLSVHPKKYVGLCQAQIAGSSPDSRSFNDGDGFLPAEAVGAVLLKPLGQAIEDGDTIFAVIKSSMTNHGGHSTGYFAPNPQAQKQLIEDNLRKSAVSPESIGYIEAAANGASLGDAIEFRMLTEVFDASRIGQPCCPIGTVKSNIGHPEAASGITQLAKVVMQFRHKQLPPTIGIRSLNPNIDFDRTPFRLVDKLGPWDEVVVDGRILPRRAMISSFGAGGSNANLIVEEYRVEPLASGPFTQNDADGAPSEEVVVLSARTSDELRAMARRLLERLRNSAERIESPATLADVAYTLQLHREAMDYRLALIVGDLTQLTDGLNQFLLAKGASVTSAVVPMFVGNSHEHAPIRELLAGRAGDAIVQVFLAEGDLPKLALHWVQGGSVPWRSLQRRKGVRRVSLPTYPFTKSSYWLAGSGTLPPDDGQGGGGGLVPSGGGISPEEGATTTSQQIEGELPTMEKNLASSLSMILQIRSEDIHRHKPLLDYGLDSMLAMQLAREFQQRYGISIANRDLLDGPTLSTLAARLLAKRGQIATKGGVSRYQVLTDQPPPTMNASGRVALSVGQTGLWVLEGVEETGAGYNVPVAMTCRGRLDRPAFNAACAFLYRLHPILATQVGEEHGIPYQWVPEMTAEQLAAVVTYHGGETASIVDSVKARAKQPFQVDGGPLTRIDVFSGDEQEHVVLLTVHHMIFDGTSAMLLLDVLLDAYECYSSGVNPDTRYSFPSTVAYHGFVEWEQEMLSGSEGESHLNYWKEQLSGELPQVLPPPDRNTIGSVKHGATYSRLLPPEIAAAVRVFSAERKIRPACLFLGVFKLFLAVCTNERDIIVGMPVAIRPDRRFEKAIGYFVNMVPMRSKMSFHDSFAEFAEGLRYTMADALDHAAYPFPALVKKLHLARRDNESPIFRVFYAYQNFVKPYGSAREYENSTRGQLQWKLLETVSQEGEYELGMQVFEDIEDSFKVEIKFSLERYLESSVKQMMEQFLSLLERCLSTPEASLTALTAPRDGEGERCQRQWNVTETSYPSESGIADLFSTISAEASERVAVVSGLEVMTYGELNQRSSQLALYLIDLGVQRDNLVGILTRRSMDMVIGLLAILKAGGAYLPLDPSYPEARLSHMLEDSGVSIILAEKEFAQYRALKNRMILELDTPAFTNMLKTYEPVKLPTGLASGRDLAYALYTSGSTGEPKGVLVEQRSVLRLVINSDFVPLSKDTVLLHCSSISFDAATLEIWGSLLNGGKLVLYSEPILDMQELIRLIDANEVTTAWMTARLFDQFGSLCERALPSLRYLLVGGDVVSPQSISTVYRMHPQLQIVNGYGPTENTTFSTCYTVPQDFDESRPVPIGRPISNSSAYVLDDQLGLVPPGCIGELYVGGDGVARAYLNQADLTAERFIANPFSEEPGGKLYRTGDLARWTADGVLEFFGRTDRQVKIRGFRIELEEIENLLRRNEGVREAAVMTHRDRERLSAYVVEISGAGLTRQGLRNYLSRYLPDYAIPAVIVLLDHPLPLTINGKLDQKALRDIILAETEHSHLGPSTQEEEILAAIWSDVLQIEEPCIDADFFELGGDSLLAMQVMLRVRERLAVNMSVRALFEARSIRRLAEYLGTHRNEKQSLPPRLLAGALDERHPPSFAQEGLWFLEQLGLLGPAYHIPVVFLLNGPLDSKLLERSLSTFQRRHESLRTRFEASEGHCVLVVDEPGNVSLPCTDLSIFDREEQESEFKRRVQEACLRLFDMSRGGLFRIDLFRFAKHKHALAIIFHHIVADGWSMGILARELGELYAAFESGSDPALPELPIRYADYVRWQRDWLKGDVLERQVGYWRRRLDGVPTAIALPTDHPRPATPSHRGSRLPIMFSSALSTEVTALAKREGVSLYMVLLGAFQLLLSRLSGQSDIIVGSPISGRTDRSTEGIFGLFVSMLPMRLDLSGNLNFRELLARVREMVLDAYAHQDVPFQKLVQELRVPRDLSTQPLFQIAFALQNTPQPLSIRGTDLRFEPCMDDGAANTFVKFDLSVSLMETSDGIQGALEFSSDLFERQTIDRLIEHFRILLENIVEDPGKDIERLAILDEREVRSLLPSRNKPAFEPPHLCLHELFESQARETPDRIAVSFGDQRMTYLALNDRADHLAALLRAAGVGPEMRVAICVERSLAMVVGLLGILKAGGAYVPMDPAYPIEHLSFILKDSKPVAVLGQETTLSILASVLMEGSTIPILDIDANLPYVTPDNVLSNKVSQVCTPENLAYVIYTSGSTGRPKGVMIEHRQAVRLFSATKEYFSFHENDVWTLFHSFAFDFSVWEIWGALLHGGRLVVVPVEYTRDPSAFHGLLCDEGVTVLNQTPSAFRNLLSTCIESVRENRLRYVIFGGEALDLVMLVPWFERDDYGRIQLINMYGITEVTVHATYRAITREDLAISPGSPIGSPLPDLEIYLLDTHLQPVPLGVAGELFIGGEGVARGYLNRPELNAERFIQCPFSTHEKSRLYKTGDLGRRLVGGGIEYIGRNDSQIKIRGYRIEIGEIEFRLKECEGVRDAVVVVREDTLSGKQLIAYLIPAVREAYMESHLLESVRGYLRETLPAYMLPARFILIDRIPLTPNGKRDLKTLSGLDVTGELCGAYVAPRGELEEKLCLIWAQVLSIDRVGVDDDFFMLGGDSIRSVQLVHRARAEGVDFSVVDFFKHPTISSLAKYIGESSQFKPTFDETATHGSTMPVSFRAGVYPVSSMQRVMLEKYDEHKGTGTGVYHVQQSINFYDDEPSFDAFQLAIDMLIAAHPILRTAFVLEDGEPYQVVMDDMEAPLGFKDIRHMSVLEQETYITSLMKRDRCNPFDVISGAPLHRFTWLRRSEYMVEFFMAIHHAIDDGWGNIVFLGQLFELYQVFKRRGGEGYKLPDVPNVYREFVALEAATAASEAAASYWRTQIPATFAYPAGISEAPVEHEDIDVEAHLDGKYGERVRNACRLMRVSLKAFYLSVYLVSLEQVASGHGRYAVGVVMNGRTAQLSNPFESLGLFWNMVPLSERVPKAGVRARIAGIHRQLLEIEPFANYPVRELLPDLDEKLFATFNFTNFHHSEHAFVGVQNGLKILGVRGHDKFHYPLNFSLHLNQHDAAGVIKVHCDGRYFSWEKASAVVATFRTTLERTLSELEGL